MQRVLDGMTSLALERDIHDTPGSELPHKTSFKALAIDVDFKIPDPWYLDWFCECIIACE